MRTPQNQIFADIDFLVDELGMNADECDEVLHACDELGGISAEYFCEEFVFVCEDENGEEDLDALNRIHDDNYLTINWGLS